MVRQNLQLYFVWRIDETVSNTSKIGANLADLSPVLGQFGLSSNLKYLRIFRPRSRGIVFEKTEIPYSLL